MIWTLLLTVPFIHPSVDPICFSLPVSSSICLSIFHFIDLPVFHLFHHLSCLFRSFPPPFRHSSLLSICLCHPSFYIVFSCQSILLLIHRIVLFIHPIIVLILSVCCTSVSPFLHPSMFFLPFFCSLHIVVFAICFCHQLTTNFSIYKWTKTI